jgi:hypothetical protein
MAVCSENVTKHVNASCVQNSDSLIDVTVGTYIYHWDLNVNWFVILFSFLSRLLQVKKAL